MNLVGFYLLCTSSWSIVQHLRKQPWDDTPRRDSWRQGQQWRSPPPQGSFGWYFILQWLVPECFHRWIESIVALPCLRLAKLLWRSNMVVCVCVLWDQMVHTLYRISGCVVLVQQNFSFRHFDVLAILPWQFFICDTNVIVIALTAFCTSVQEQTGVDSKCYSCHTFSWKKGSFFNTTESSAKGSSTADADESSPRRDHARVWLGLVVIVSPKNCKREMGRLCVEQLPLFRIWDGSWSMFEISKLNLAETWNVDCTRQQIWNFVRLVKQTPRPDNTGWIRMWEDSCGL